MSDFSVFTCQLNSYFWLIIVFLQRTGSFWSLSDYPTFPFSKRQHEDGDGGAGRRVKLLIQFCVVLWLPLQTPVKTSKTSDPRGL